LRDAPLSLANKHYNKYTGKYSQISDWTLLKRYLEQELKELDAVYKRARRRRPAETREKPQGVKKHISL